MKYDWNARKKELTQLELKIMELLTTDSRMEGHPFQNYEEIWQEAELALCRKVTLDEFMGAMKRLAARGVIETKVERSE